MIETRLNSSQCEEVSNRALVILNDLLFDYYWSAFNIRSKYPAKYRVIQRLEKRWKRIHKEIETKRSQWCGY